MRRKKLICVRIPKTLLDRVNRLKEAIVEESLPGTYGIRISRALAVRVLLEKAVKEYEGESLDQQQADPDSGQ